MFTRTQLTPRSGFCIECKWKCCLHLAASIWLIFIEKFYFSSRRARTSVCVLVSKQILTNITCVVRKKVAVNVKTQRIFWLLPNGNIIGLTTMGMLNVLILQNHFLTHGTIRDRYSAQRNQIFNEVAHRSRWTCFEWFEFFVEPLSASEEIRRERNRESNKAGSGRTERQNDGATKRVNTPIA